MITAGAGFIQFLGPDFGFWFIEVRIVDLNDPQRSPGDFTFSLLCHAVKKVTRNSNALKRDGSVSCLLPYKRRNKPISYIELEKHKLDRSDICKKHKKVSRQTYSFLEVKLRRLQRKTYKDKYDIRDKNHLYLQTVLIKHPGQASQTTCSR